MSEEERIRFERRKERFQKQAGMSVSTTKDLDRYERFLNEQHFPIDEDLFTDPLKIHRDNIHLYPSLRSMIRDYLSLPAGSFGNERDFSVSTRISTSVRGANMSADTLRRDTCLSIWTRDDRFATDFDAKW